MIQLIEQRAEKILYLAQQEINALDPDARPGIVPSSEQERARVAVEQMIRRMRGRVEGKSGEDYVIKEKDSGTLLDEDAAAWAATSAAMGAASTQRTEYFIRKEVSYALRSLINMGVREIDAYDSHAQAILEPLYKSLENRRGGKVARTSVNTNTTAVTTPGSAQRSPHVGQSANSSVSGHVGYRREEPQSTTRPPQGILSNRNVKSPIDFEAYRRMSIDEGRLDSPKYPESTSPNGPYGSYGRRPSSGGRS